METEFNPREKEIASKAFQLGLIIGLSCGMVLTSAVIKLFFY